MNEDLTGRAKFINPFNPAAGLVPYSGHSRADWTNQFYGEYTVGKLRIDSEYRRFLHESGITAALHPVRELTDVRGWYVSGAYRVIKRLVLGSYYSRYSVTSVAGGPSLCCSPPN